MSKTFSEIQNLPLCDIVMEGGITSGVIYPHAVVELSEKYRFKNIGGTSVGAIAAAATAAAELGRLRDPLKNPGFVRLAKLTEELSKKVDSNENTTRLLNLFQPQEKTRPLYLILISALNHKTAGRMLLGCILGVLRAFPLRILLTITIFFATVIYSEPQNIFIWITALISSLSVAALIATASVWKVIKGPLVNNGYGICKGYHEGADNEIANGDTNEPLTLWLSRLLNECASKEINGTPLIFEELWNDTGDSKLKPPQWLQDAGLSSWEYINLQMVTTNITHSRPYCFPLKNDVDDEKLYFSEKDLRELFPSNVVKHMIEKSPHSQKRLIEKFPGYQIEEVYYKLPPSGKLPVVFATRLSLSFPFLLSAIPLYAWDHENPIQSKQELKKCWFSDGGISSNFPIHLFDAPLPLWPTFGIKLENEQTQRPIQDNLSNNLLATDNDKNRFFFPSSNEKGRGDNWLRFDDEVNNKNKLFGFLIGLFETAKNWRDHTLTRSPAVRDRVVRIYLKKSEGGLNLNMKKEIIEDLSNCGKKAAEMLIERFLPNSIDHMNFNNHRWVRLRKLAYVIDKDFSALKAAISAKSPDLISWSDLIDSNFLDEDRYQISQDQKKKLHDLLIKLEELSEIASSLPSMQDENAPKRATTLRIVPDI